jgi:hypothetical protein
MIAKDVYYYNWNLYNFTSRLEKKIQGLSLTELFACSMDLLFIFLGDSSRASQDM